jgi:hypothetical protein
MNFFLREGAREKFEERRGDGKGAEGSSEEGEDGREGRWIRSKG